MHDVNFNVMIELAMIKLKTQNLDGNGQENN